MAPKVAEQAPTANATTTNASTAPPNDANSGASAGQGTIDDDLTLPRGTKDPDFGRKREVKLEAKHDEPANASKPRKLILLCDGSTCDANIINVNKTLTDQDVKDPKKIYPRATWANFHIMEIAPNLSNVYEMGQMLLGPNGDGDMGGWYQEIHYQTGVGTDWEDLTKLTNMLTMNTGLGVNERIKAGYTWLCNRYRDHNDRIFLVGFSRGALIARTIGGWIALQGLLHRNQTILKTDAAIADMYELYKQKQPAKSTYESGDTFLTPDIQAELLWDTVPGLGILSWNIFTDIPLTAINAVTKNYDHLHSLQLSPKIKNAYHVLALTEHKALFTVIPWEKEDRATSNLEQVWFPGQHEDVGGGLSDDHGATYVTLAWMMDKAVDVGLTFDDAYFKALVARLVAYYKNHKSSQRDPLVNGEVRLWGLAQTHDSQRDMSFGMGITPMQKSDRKPAPYQYQRKMHKSVRLRYGHKDKAHLGASGGGAFNPYALNNWEPVQSTPASSGFGASDASTAGAAAGGTGGGTTGVTGAPAKWGWKYSSSWYGNKTIPEAEIKANGYETMLMKLLHDARYQGTSAPPEEVDPDSYEATSSFFKNLGKALHRDI